jgi:hypothetical protein
MPILIEELLLDHKSYQDIIEEELRILDTML